MITGRQDIRQAGQISNFFHGLRFILELQEVEVGIGYQNVFRLAADPATHVNITVSAAGPRRVDVQTDTGFLFFAVSATTARHVKWDRNQIPDLEEFDSLTFFNDFPRNLMT